MVLEVLDNKVQDDATVSLQIQQFLDEWHYRIISTPLNNQFDRPQATVAALQIFELQGMSFAPGEQEKLAELEEATMIMQLVAKMPEEFKAQFEHFALQLQLICSTATRVRKVIDEADEAAVADVMGATNPDNSGIISQILKKAVVQAGKEVGAIRNRHDSWVKNTDHRVARLVRCADDAANAQNELRSVQAKLGSFGGNMNEKSKKALMGVAANNDKALVMTIFSTWYAHQQKMKSEKEIRDKFEAEIETAEMKLLEYKQNAMNNVRNVLMRKAAEGDAGLMIQVWKAWKDEVQETKHAAGSQADMKAMEEKLSGMMAAQAENTKKVMTRMSGASDSALLVVVLGGWKQWLEDYKKNKEEEDAIKAQEAAMAEYMKQKKEGAKNMLDKMNASTDSGLVEHVISSWCQMFKDDKEAKKLDEMMNAEGSKFASLNGRQKDNAKGVMGRVNEQLDLNCMLRHFCAWALDCKLERVMRHYNKKMDSKKHQLHSVQQLFSSFANQLDQGLKGDDSARRGSGGDSSRRREDGSIMLPDINAKR